MVADGASQNLFYETTRASIYESMKEGRKERKRNTKPRRAKERKDTRAMLRASFFDIFHDHMVYETVNIR